MAEYQTRAIVLHQTINFKEESPQQQLWLQVIFTLLSELLTLPLGPGNPSKTLKTIQEAVTIANFFGHSRTEQSSDLFCAIQLVSITRPWHSFRITDHPVNLVSDCPLSGQGVLRMLPPYRI